MVDPRCMCRQHLLGEHYEIHSFAGLWSKGKQPKRILGYLKNGLIDPRRLKQRHDDLVKEMLHRNMLGHKTPMSELVVPDDTLYVYINPERNLEELATRCEKCRTRSLEVRSLNTPID